MARKVYVNVTTRLILNMDEGVDVDEVISELDYSFGTDDDRVEMLDTEIIDYEVKDSK